MVPIWKLLGIGSAKGPWYFEIIFAVILLFLGSDDDVRSKYLSCATWSLDWLYGSIKILDFVIEPQSGLENWVEVKLPMVATKYCKHLVCSCYFSIFYLV